MTEKKTYKQKINYLLSNNKVYDTIIRILEHNKHNTKEIDLKQLST